MTGFYRAVLTATVLLIPATAGAQTPPPPPAARPPMPMPTKVAKTDFRYFTIEQVVSRPGARLWELWSKHMLPAYKAAGVPAPLVYHTETGTSHTIIVTELSGGPGDVAYTVTADDLKLLNALATLEGSKEKAMALLKEYDDGIETRTREIVHMHRP